MNEKANDIVTNFKDNLTSKDLTLHFDGKSVKEFTGGPVTFIRRGLLAFCLLPPFPAHRFLVYLLQKAP